MITKKREELIAKFQRWLDTDPNPMLIAYECANIAEAYAKQCAWEVWKYVTDQYETHSINEPLERFIFEKWWKENNK